MIVDEGEARINYHLLVYTRSWTITNPEFCKSAKILQICKDFTNLFVIVHGWQNENNKMAENFFLQVFARNFAKIKHAKSQKDYKIGSEDLQR